MTANTGVTGGHYIQFSKIVVLTQCLQSDIVSNLNTNMVLPVDTLYRMSQEECARLREGVPYVKVYRYNPKHLCPKLNGYGDKGARKVWFSCGSTYCTWFM